MNTFYIPADLYERGFINQQQLNRSDIPVQYNSRMYPIINFANTHLEKVAKPNPEVDSDWLMRIYSSAEGIRFTYGEFIAALVSTGFSYERKGSGAVFGITKESVIKTEDRFSVQLVTSLPKMYLHFPGRKAFNSLPLKNKAGLINDFMKNHLLPKPFNPTYLLNKSDNMAIRFALDGHNRVAEAVALKYEDAIQEMNLNKESKKIVTSEQSELR